MVEREVYVVCGGSQFILETRAMKIIKKKVKLPYLERVALSPGMTHDFPALFQYCRKNGVAFKKSCPASDFFLEAGNGVYVCRAEEIKEAVKVFAGQNLEITVTQVP